MLKSHFKTKSVTNLNSRLVTKYGIEILRFLIFKVLRYHNNKVMNTNLKPSSFSIFFPASCNYNMKAHYCLSMEA